MSSRLVVLASALTCGLAFALTAEAAVPCHPLPAVAVALTFDDADACRAALDTGGACDVVTTVANPSGVAVALGRQLVGDFSGSIPSAPARGATSALLGTAHTLTAKAATTVAVQDRITFAPDTRSACLRAVVYTNNAACGNADARRQHPVGSAGACVLHASYPASGYVRRESCSSPAWYASGGTCAPSATCWHHDQLFTRDLSPAESLRWGALNCCATCTQVNTVPLRSDGDGPYGYDLD